MTKSINWRTAGDKFKSYEHGLNHAGIIGIERSHAHQGSIWSEETWKMHRKAAGNGGPALVKAELPRKDWQRFQGDHIMIGFLPI
jgi:hypothetical protein